MKNKILFYLLLMVALLLTGCNCGDSSESASSNDDGKYIARGKVLDSWISKDESAAYVESVKGSSEYFVSLFPKRNFEHFVVERDANIYTTEGLLSLGIDVSKAITYAEYITKCKALEGPFYKVVEKRLEKNGVDSSVFFRRIEYSWKGNSGTNGEFEVSEDKMYIYKLFLNNPDHHLLFQVGDICSAKEMPLAAFDGKLKNILPIVEKPEG
jgi:hypothetical protein